MKKTATKPQKKTEPSSDPKADALELYRQKRDPLSTNEPFGTEHKPAARETRTGRFVVHLHDATRPHYDLRLQIGGTLKSFAVPRGPSLKPLDKHLAVLTEDHPLEYLEFEEVIPEGNYGAGAMIAWDIGRVRYLETTAERGLEIGKLDFELDGFKLHGRFALVATGRRKASGPNDKKANEWLLIKKQDAFSNPNSDIVNELPHSVMSGLTVQELAERDRLVSELEAEAEALGAVRAAVDVSSFTPMLCALEGAELVDDSRLYELKIDGVRIVADKHGKAVALRYRNGRAASSSYPEIARAVASLAPERVVLDGEVVAFDNVGRPSFQRIAPRIHAMRPHDVRAAMNEAPVSYLVFDLLALGAFDLRNVPLLSRKSLLMKLVRGRGYIRALDHLEGDGRPLFELCRTERLEGVVAKRVSSIYRPGPKRTDDWVKLKSERDDEFVVIGFMTGKGTRGMVGALCVASYAGDELVYRGRVGSGMDAAMLKTMQAELESRIVQEFPASGEPPEDAKGAIWVRPELVVSVRFLGFTESDHRLRAPVFRGLRSDIEPRDCRAAPPDEMIEATPALVAEESRASLAEAGDQAESGPLPRRGLPAREASSALNPKSASSEASAPSAVRRVTISNPNKVFWPDEGYTKGDLCAYYTAIAEVMLPFLHERPVVLVRYPDGIKGKYFYQWNVPAGTPDWIERIELIDEDDANHQRKTLFLIDSVDALVHIANLGCIPLHVLAAQRGSLDQCDFLTVDFDLGERPFSDAVRLALDLRAILDDVGLIGFPKTSGQRGLHVLVPLGPGVNYDTAKLLVELLGRLVTDKNPTIATMERRVNQRGARAYVDTGQTGPSRTIVAPYSVRSHPGATVSTPISWNELHVALDPSRFTMLTVPNRVQEVGDPFAGFMSARPNVPAAVAALSKYL
ncbi:MAG TPA: DNA ligase D [Polyangiaceae bacterium]|nr:DNA ligase D [Polyangiaceae bacterium]